MPWVRENMATSKEHYFIDHNTGAASYEDLRLMSHCKHTIVANSSFSWWGCWLNAHPQKIVIAPRQWMIDPNLLQKTSYLIHGSDCNRHLVWTLS
jgi:hypothetical protein